MFGEDESFKFLTADWLALTKLRKYLKGEGYFRIVNESRFDKLSFRHSQENNNQRSLRFNYKL